MTRPPRRLTDSIEVVRVTPRRATAMLIHGLLPVDEVEGFKPANLSTQAIIKMLHHANEVRNRTVSLDTVRKYARDMTEDRWLWTGEPIQLDHDGFVRNGQHRLLAVIESGTTQDFFVVKDLDPLAQLVIDVGRPRTIANQMHMSGVHNATLSAAIANVLIRWREGKMFSTYSPSVLQVQNVIAGEEQFTDALALIYRVRRNMRRVPVSSIGAAYIEAGHLDRTARDNFFEALVTGADLAVDDPRLVLRNTLSRQLAHSVRGRRAGQLYQVVHAWNLWRKDETIRFLRIPTTLTSETFPKMR